MTRAGLAPASVVQLRWTHTLKKEEVHLVNYFDYNTARIAIFEYIEAWYNRKRIHGSIGYISP
ncbi:hypothetical protein E8P77_20655 [Soehngenia saccharolytica]|nr:hypothetical protein E8P77_20655 [Soehngenia saccharolytica]